MREELRTEIVKALHVAATRLPDLPDLSADLDKLALEVGTELEEGDGGGRGEPAGAERYDEPAQGGSQPRQQQRSQQQAPANNGDPGPQYDYDGMDEPF